ncbi:MAG: hypothetical protein Ct9H300mP23_07690 [Nitrospinota bacterium]|nr:MAG: hypothetical protein Ct9H300mP23_07690 [Nitrospinota bacterium]
MFSVGSFGFTRYLKFFIGEFLVLVGTSYASFAMVLISMVGILLAAAYMLWMLQRGGFGGEPKTEVAKVIPDLSNRELATLNFPTSYSFLFIGLYPGPFMEMMDASGVFTSSTKQQACKVDEVSQLPFGPFLENFFFSL